MTPEEVLLRNMSPTIRSEKMICKNCGRISQAGTYCDWCDETQ